MGKWCGLFVIFLLFLDVSRIRNTEKQQIFLVETKFEESFLVNSWENQKTVTNWD